jgi:adenylyltransferase/sulfurtransferase
MSTIRIPTPLRSYTQGEKELEIQGSTVGEALQALGEQYPAVKPHLFDEEGELRSYVNLYLNDDDIRSLAGANTPIEPGDKLMIIPSIAGGYSA